MCGPWNLAAGRARFDLIRKAIGNTIGYGMEKIGTIKITSDKDGSARFYKGREYTRVVQKLQFLNNNRLKTAETVDFVTKSTVSGRPVQ
jgi:hypothetical protein